MLLRHLALGTMIVALTLAACSDKDGRTTAPNTGSTAWGDGWRKRG